MSDLEKGIWSSELGVEEDALPDIDTDCIRKLNRVPQERSGADDKCYRAERRAERTIYSLEHVRFDDSVAFCGFKEHGDLLHLLEGHTGGFNGLNGFVGSIQAVDELTQYLNTEQIPLINTAT
ncbi:hypothetical protein CCH79_00002051, partial [Gambusia affinis]